ncbi:MAG: glycosyltransferase family 2 protein [Candidatus Bathyarchaeia archaeon]
MNTAVSKSRESFHNLGRNDEPLVSIIILNFNGRDMLRECLQSVFKTKYSNYEVIVVDNGSTDNSCTMVEREFPNVRLIKNPRNFGYSKGNNIGILRSRGEFIVLLNNDTIVTPEWLSELMHEAIQNLYCFYQPKILFNESKRINSAGNFIQLFGFAFPRGIGDLDNGQYDEKCEVSYASGACVLVSKRLVEKVGLLDEGLFTFYEDVNWGWKALMLGYKTAYVPSAIIYHRWGGSWGNVISSKKFFLIERSRLLTLFRNYSSRTLLKIFPAFIFTEVLVLLFSLEKGFIREKLRVYSDMLRVRDILFHQRKAVQKMRKISDERVIKFFCDGINHPYLGKLAVSVNKLICLFSKIVRMMIR